jgi:hypothetical protein
MKESTDQRMIDTVMINGLLKAMQDRIQTDALPDRLPGIGFKFLQELRFIAMMETVHNFIGEPDKAINAVHRCAKILMQQTNGSSKGCAVGLCSSPTASITYMVE